MLPAFKLILAVVYKVGNVVVDPAPEPICKAAPEDTVNVPVPLPVIWLPPSLNVPEAIVRFPATVIAPVMVVVTAAPVPMSKVPKVCPVSPPAGPVAGE